MVIKLFTTTFSTFNIIYNGFMYQLIFQEIMKIPRLATVIPNSFICCWSDVSKHLNQHTPFHNLSMALIIIKVKVTFVRIVWSCYSSLNLPVSLISVRFFLQVTLHHSPAHYNLARIPASQSSSLVQYQNNTEQATTPSMVLYQETAVTGRSQWKGLCLLCIITSYKHTS